MNGEGVGFRPPALAGVGLLTFAYASVLFHVANVVGVAARFLAVVGASLALALVLGRLVRPRGAALVAAVLVAGGALGYLLSVPEVQRTLLLSGRIVPDTLALLTGLSIVHLTNAGVWAMAVAPAPVFVSWYLAVRRRYVASVTAGGLALCLFVLTGDATPLTTLAGVVGATAAVGLGTLEARGGSAAQLDSLTATIAAMVVASASLSLLLPGAAGGAMALQPGSPTVESNLVEAEDRVDVRGSLRLSPDVRFTVASTEPRYWQTAAYDRYTGDGWVRTGSARPYRDRLPEPPGSARTVRQRVTARTPLGALPAAWRPAELDGPVAETAVTTPQGGVRPAETLAVGESYTVISRVPRHTETQLRRTGTDYPDRIENGYLQLPGTTPDRVHERADAVTADADSPYAKARAVERHLETTKRYSLNVSEPEGSVADAFLFEMEAGYCTYYATTMVTMLRAEGVPARFVVGYTAGRPRGGTNGSTADGSGPDGDREYVVRGLDAHAWVQVYFPDVGWVNFDPTPEAPRQAAERERLAAGSDGGGSGGSAPATTPEAPPATAAPALDDPNFSATPSIAPEPAGSADGGGGDGYDLPALPSQRTLALWTVALAGVLAVGRRTGVAGRAADAVRLRRQPRADPATDVVRAYRRVERLFARRHRPRRAGETPRAYVETLVGDGNAGSAGRAERAGSDGPAGTADPRALRVVDAYERVRYGGGVSREEADAVVAAVDSLTRESVPVLRRFAD